MVVDQAVAAAGELAGGAFKGLVNGVLRNYLRQRDACMRPWPTTTRRRTSTSGAGGWPACVVPTPIGSKSSPSAIPSRR
jgi:hypothetical protein